jgi:hypothetical protein
VAARLRRRGLARSGLADEAAGIDIALLEQARDYALTGSGSGYVIHRGYLVFSWGDPEYRYLVQSVTKSIGGTALGVSRWRTGW